MKLASKLVLVVVAGTLALFVVYGYYTVSSDMEAFDTDMQRDAESFGQDLREMVRRTWTRSGKRAALGLIQSVDREHPRIGIRWVWLDDKAEPQHRPRAPRDRLEPALRGEVVAYRQPEGKAERLLCTYVPAQIPNERPGALELTESLTQLQTFFRSAVVRLVGLAAATALLAALVAFVLGTRLIGRPTMDIIEKARRIGRGDPTEPLPVRGTDELAELASVLNSVGDELAAARARLVEESSARLAALEALRRADRLRTVGQIASGIAHELGTPLNVVAGWASLIASGTLPPKDVAERGATIKTQCDRMTGFVRRLLEYSRMRAPERRRVDLLALVRETLDLLQPVARPRRVSLAVAPDARPAALDADGAQLQQVLTNLLVNALQASEPGGAVLVWTGARGARPPNAAPEAEERRCLAVAVRDGGRGIPAEVLPHIFDPFFSTKHEGEGTGLGLSIAREIANEHGGWIDVTSEVGRGSCFTLLLPAEEVPACPAA